MAKWTVLRLLREFHLSVAALKQSLCNLCQRLKLLPLPPLEKGLPESFSKVEYAAVAPLVNLKPKRNLNDIKSFPIRRARIPTTMFRTIVEDMDVLLPQYGSFSFHKNDEARSRFLAPVSNPSLRSGYYLLIFKIFNRLVAAFGFGTCNKPESRIQGRISTQDEIEYHFTSLGRMSLLFIEVKFEIGHLEDCQKVAQVIAECDSKLDLWCLIFHYSHRSQQAVTIKIPF